jgi:hypothetical protein
MPTGKYADIEQMCEVEDRGKDAEGGELDINSST